MNRLLEDKVQEILSGKNIEKESKKSKESSPSNKIKNDKVAGA